MGKVRKSRKKLHISRERAETKNLQHFTSRQNDETGLQNGDAPFSPTLPTLLLNEETSHSKSSAPDISNNGIFAGIDIKFEDLKKDLNCGDSRSMVSASKREFKKRIGSKKDRRLARHETFISKISAIQKMKVEKREKRRHQKRAIIRDLKPLIASLPVVECHNNTEKKRPASKKRSIPKLKWRQRNMLHDVASFKKLLQDPSFKLDPSTAVASLIQERIRQNIENA